MKNWNKFCCIFLAGAFFTSSIFAQIPTQSRFQPYSMPPVEGLQHPVIPNVKLSLTTTRPSFSKILQKNYNSAYNASGSLSLNPILASDFYSVNQHAFFCRMEMRLDKIHEAPFQVRIRLGSLQANDWLEQKPLVLPPDLW